MAAATLATILDNLNDYADYEEVGSVTRAKSFITAAKRFLQLPANQASQGESLGYNHQSVQQMLTHARAYVQAGSTSSVRFLSVKNGFR